MTNTMYMETLAPFHIRFTCPHCQAVRQVPEQYIGQTGQCTTCGGAITITAPALPHVSTAAQSKDWYRRRAAHFAYCQENYEQARAAFPPIENDAYWQRKIQEAANCPNHLEQVALWEALVAEGIPWPVAYEYLVHYHVKDRDYERAFYFCALFFHSDRWKNPQCAGSSYKLLKTMRKLDKKLHPDFED